MTAAKTPPASPTASASFAPPATATPDAGSAPLAPGATRCLLASSSPRRSQLLGQLGWQVQLVSAHTEEVWPTLPPGPAAVQVAADKLAAARARFAASLDPAGAALWLAADTVVVLDGDILGKPRDAAHAKDMLRRLAGRTHEVITGFVLAQGERREQHAVTSQVTMRAYGAAEIDAYVAGGEALDKSGAYAIQSGGTVLSARLSGSLSNIVGLPVAEVVAAADALRRARS